MSSPPLFLSHPPPQSSSATPVFHMNSNPIWGALLRLATMALTKLTHRTLLSCPDRITSFLAIPSLQLSVPSPALTDHMISTRQQCLKRRTSLHPWSNTSSMATRDAHLPLLDAVQPLFGPVVPPSLSYHRHEIQSLVEDGLHCLLSPS